MKKLVVALFLMSSSAFAGEMKQIAIMATESVEEFLFLNDGDHFYTINHQKLVNPEQNAVIAVETEISVGDIHSGRVKNWICTTQFIKPAEVFEVFKTECKNLKK